MISSLIQRASQPTGMECGMQAGEFWKWTDDANRQPMALEHEELAEVITAWPILSADLRKAILEIV
jgi:hypothetical protein